MADGEVPFRIRDDRETISARLERRARELLDSSPDLHERIARPEVSAQLGEAGLPTREIMARVMEGYRDRPALGRRAFSRVEDPKTGVTEIRLLPGYEHTSYGELWRRIRLLASYWTSNGVVTPGSGDFIAILGIPSIDHVVVDFATLEAQAVSIPLPAAMGVTQLVEILMDTRPRVLAVSLAYLGKALEAVVAAGIQVRLLVIDVDLGVDRDLAALADVQRRSEGGEVRSPIETIDAFCATAAAAPPPRLPTVHVDADALSVIFYTSGSTGSPKGAMLSERLCHHMWSLPTHLPDSAPLPSVMLNYQPLSHLSGRTHLCRSVMVGGLFCFVGSTDLSTLFEDFSLVRPTNVLLVPRITEFVVRHFQAEVARLIADGVEPNVSRLRVMTDMRAHYLGGRVLTALTGTAPCPVDVRRFIDECFDVDLLDAYGSTETTFVSMNGIVQRPPVQDYRLVDVPELGYFTTDKPYPRGELHLKSSFIMSGYYNKPELTASCFDENGFFCTGDVMEERAPDHLVYVDRRNNVLKLSQGEFVAVSKLETLYATGSTLIDQIYVYGNSERSFLLAVVVPDTENMSARLGNDASVADRQEAISQELAAVAREQGLNSYEIPRALILDNEPFSTANGLLTDSRKPRRTELKARYGARLDALYQEISDRQVERLEVLRRGTGTLPVIDVLAEAVTASLGIDGGEGIRQRNFADLGGDSLSAVSFGLLIGELFGVEVPIGSILSESGTLTTLAAEIERALSGEVTARPTYSEIHPDGRGRIRASELTLDRLLQTTLLNAAAGLDGIPEGAPTTVLLTGANGYLGRFLCLELLERSAARGNGKVICLLRGSSDENAHDRLVRAFGDANSELGARFAALAGGHLEVVSGDIAAPRLGLDAAIWSRLADEVDAIMHPAALVNHVLPYRQLFEPNVLGTAELVSLALTSRKKRLAYVSSVAVRAGAHGAFDEKDDVRHTIPEQVLTDAYASGYGVSKWAGEVILRDAHERFGLPIDIFRSDMILGHSRFDGQINRNDIFSRLLLSLVLTGIAPDSFYRDAGGVHADRAHYDGLPVDFIACAIVAIVLGKDPTGFATYHVVNPHDDGVSLDQFVAWIAEQGFPIERLGAYGFWLERFRAALLELPDAVRSQTSLAALDQLAEPVPAIAGAAVTTHQFEKRIEELLDQTGPIPSLSAAFIAKCIDDLRPSILLGQQSRRNISEHQD